MNTEKHARLENVRGIGPKRYAIVLKRLEELEKSIDELFKMPTSEIVAQFKLPENVAEAISQSTQMVSASPDVGNLTQKNIKKVTRGDATYPQRLEKILGEKAPQVLYMWGNLDLLNKPAVGFCGSRNVSERGLEVTAETAQQIVDEGWVVVSGHARGVDTIAHKTALEKGGGTIIIAPEGILQFRLRQELKKIATPEQILIVSEFPPDRRWSVANAMTRNKTIIGFSDALILVEARTEGGTFEAGKAALRLKVPLYVAQYQSPAQSATGNNYFLERGAKRLLKNSDSGKPNLDDLYKTVRGEYTSGQNGQAQTTSSEQMLLPL
jgi:DNA processing protein